MKLVRVEYSLKYEVQWDNEAEETRARSLPPAAEIFIMQKIAEYEEVILSLVIDVPGPEGELNKANRNVMQGKLLALQELLQDSREAHTKLFGAGENA